MDALGGGGGAREGRVCGSGVHQKVLQKCKKPSLQAGRAFNAMDQKEKPSTVVEGFADRFRSKDQEASGAV
jgi:hypothetical protein